MKELYFIAELGCCRRVGQFFPKPRHWPGFQNHSILECFERNTRKRSWKWLTKWCFRYCNSHATKGKLTESIFIYKIIQVWVLYRSYFVQVQWRLCEIGLEDYLFVLLSRYSFFRLPIACFLVYYRGLQCMVNWIVCKASILGNSVGNIWQWQACLLHNSYSVDQTWR